MLSAPTPIRESGRTRLAPSPTGALHLGNARTFLANWLLARKLNWRVILRIEDLDGPRIKSGAAQQAIDDLEWLGLDWDEGPITQSSRVTEYHAAIDHLVRTGHVYPCVCTRREAQLAASAPHREDENEIYPGTCRGRFASIEDAQSQTGKAAVLRFRVQDEMIEFVDRFAGAQSFSAASQLGDFVIAKADGTAAYQLAVVVDDLAMNVTEVVRGDDLLDSAARQILIYRALRAADRVPHYTHLPLVVGMDGRRLAKRHGDTRVSHYREAGVGRGEMLALLARWLGIESAGTIRDASQLIDRFDLEKIPRESIVFDAQAWNHAERLG